MDTQLQTRLASLKPSDKTLGAILALALLAGGGWVLYTVLPILITLATNAIVFFAEIVALIMMIVFVATNLTNGYYFFCNVARKIRRAIVADDPIGTLVTVEHRYERRLEDIDSGITAFGGSIKRQEDSVASAHSKAEKEKYQASTAQKTGRPSVEVAQHATASQRWEKAADEMQPMLTTCKNALTFMQQARDLCSAKLDDARNQRAVLAAKLDAAQSGQHAVRMFKRFFGSNPDLEMHEMAVEEIERQQTEAFAEMDQFMRVSKPVLDAASLEQATDQMQAMEKFNAYITGGGASRMLTASSDQIQIPNRVKEGVVVGDKASRYLDMSGESK